MTGTEAHQEIDDDLCTTLQVLPHVQMYIKIATKGKPDPLTIKLKYKKNEHGFLQVHVSRILKFPDCKRAESHYD